MAMIKVTRLPNSLTGFFTPLKDFFSPAQWEHFRFLILAFCVISGRRTIRNLRNGLSDRHSHRTNLHDFVIQAEWDPVVVTQEATLGLLKRLKPQKNERIYLIIDDTKIEKRGTRMDGLGTYHDTAKKHITGHDVVSAVLLFRGLVLPWAMDLHEAKKKPRRCKLSVSNYRSALETVPDICVTRTLWVLCSVDRSGPAMRSRRRGPPAAILYGKRNRHCSNGPDLERLVCAFCPLDGTDLQERSCQVTSLPGGARTARSAGKKGMDGIRHRVPALRDRIGAVSGDVLRLEAIEGFSSR